MQKGFITIALATSLAVVGLTTVRANSAPRPVLSRESAPPTFWQWFTGNLPVPAAAGTGIVLPETCRHQIFVLGQPDPARFNQACLERYISPARLPADCLTHHIGPYFAGPVYTRSCLEGAGYGFEANPRSPFRPEAN